MKKLLIPVSGARVGDAVRPVASKLQLRAGTKQLGLRVHHTPIVSTLSPIAREDYAMPDDYPDYESKR